MHTKDQSYIAKLGFADTDKKDRHHDLACRFLAQPSKVEKLLTLLPLGSYYDRNLHRKTIKLSRLLNAANIFVEDWTREKVVEFIEQETGSQIPNTFAFPDIFVKRISTQVSGGWTITQIKPSDPVLKVDRFGNSIIVGYYDLLVCFEGHAKYYETFEIFAEVHGRKARFPANVLRLPELEAQIAETNEFEVGTIKRNRNVISQSREADCKSFRVAIEIKAGRTPVTDIIQQMITYRTFDPEAMQVLATCYQMSSDEAALLSSGGITRIFLSKDSLEEFDRQSANLALEAF